MLLLFLLLSNNGFSNNFAIRQEFKESNGICSCAPNQLDMNIKSFLIDNNIFSLQQYIVWLNTNITYKNDVNGDYWNHPEKTLKDRYGDCEDMAFLNEAVLRVLGYSGEVLGVYRWNSAHAIFVFKNNNIYSYFSNNIFINTKTTTTKAFKQYILIKYNCYKTRVLKLKEG